MKRVSVNIITGILLFILVIVLVAVTVFILHSKGQIEPYRDKDGNISPSSIAEKTVIRLNGADNGLIIRGKDVSNPVLLFVSSGPGTSDYFLNEAYPSMNLEDYFTVCYWDYRGMCLVYDRNMDPSSITTEVILEDAQAVTDYLRDRFGKDKIFIMGFSGGSHIALQSVKSHPEKYTAYFAMAQVVSSDSDNDTYIYDFMKRTFEARGDKKKLHKLEKSVEKEAGGKVKCLDWPSFIYLLHQAGGGTIKDKSEAEGIIIPILKCRCYTAKEKLNYIRGMKMYRTTPFYRDCKSRDYRREITSLDLPVFFISGDTDYNCPWPLVEEYCNILDSPSKEFLKVPDSAHSPLWENPQVTIEYMSGIALRFM